MSPKTFYEIWPQIFVFDLLRYLIPASAAFLTFWVFGRKALMHLFIQRTLPASRQLWKEFAFSMSTVLIFSVVGLGIYTAEHQGWTRIYYDPKLYGVAYMIASFAFTVLFHDFYFYWTHRLMHHPKLFRHLHRVHHESTNPSPWAAYSFHPWEALIQAMVLPVMVFTIPLHPLVIFLFLAYMILRNVIGHLGFEILPRGFTRNRWLNWNTAVTHHNMHHKHFHSNYGLYFTWWDKWMKTEDVAYHETFDEVKTRPKGMSAEAKGKGVFTFLILLVLVFPLLGQTVEGEWLTYNEETGSPISTVEIVRKGGSIQGTVKQIYLGPDQGLDPICIRCSGSRKDQKLVGLNFMWGFKQDGDNWHSGKILDPESGETYSGKLWMTAPDTLRVRGYAGPFDLFYRTQTWIREGAEADTPLGLWRTIDDRWHQPKAIVEIRRVDGELRGFIRKLFLLPHEGTNPVCIACKGEKKQMKIVGMRILWEYRYEDDRWVDGKILDPGNGVTYRSSISLLSSDTLKVRGYFGPIYRSQLWTRVH